VFGGVGAVISIAQASYGLNKDLNPGRGPPSLAPTDFNELPINYSAKALQEMGDPATATLQQLAGVDVSFVKWDRAYVSRQLLLLHALTQQHGDLLQDIVLSTFGGVEYYSRLEGSVADPPLATRDLLTWRKFLAINTFRANWRLRSGIHVWRAKGTLHSGDVRYSNVCSEGDEWSYWGQGDTHNCSWELQ
jgi:hypothetical protein